MVVYLFGCMTDWSTAWSTLQTQLITSKGYPCENHYATTEDGFILNMQRIPRGQSPKDVKGERTSSMMISRKRICVRLPLKIVCLK